MSRTVVKKSNKNFNSHAHVERDWNRIKPYFYRYYFNSHAHVERDIIVFLNDNRYIISTHTLTWSVTILVSVYHFGSKYFNSHAHVERDDILSLNEFQT